MATNISSSCVPHVVDHYGRALSRVLVGSQSAYELNEISSLLQALTSTASRQPNLEVSIGFSQLLVISWSCILLLDYAGSILKNIFKILRKQLEMKFQSFLSVGADGEAVPLTPHVCWSLVPVSTKNGKFDETEVEKPRMKSMASGWTKLKETQSNIPMRNWLI